MGTNSIHFIKVGSLLKSGQNPNATNEIKPSDILALIQNSYKYSLFLKFLPTLETISIIFSFEKHGSFIFYVDATFLLEKKINHIILNPIEKQKAFKTFSAWTSIHGNPVFIKEFSQYKDCNLRSYSNDLFALFCLHHVKGHEGVFSPYYISLKRFNRNEVYFKEGNSRYSNINQLKNLHFLEDTHELLYHNYCNWETLKLFESNNE